MGLVVSTIAIIAVLVVLFFGWPIYSVWQQRLAGEAELARAEQNRQIRINEAMAEQEAAKFEAQAEITRAEGVAASNKIVADGLGGPEGYLRYLYIRTVGAQGNQIIYLPTEAGIPVLEAGRAAR
jgi:hypothetical protein